MGETLPILSIDQDSIPVHPDAAHEWLLPTADVARGYGVQPCVIRKAKERHADELVDGIHYISVTNCHADPGNANPTQWTKLGTVYLGFFLRSERAKHFRAAAAKLVLAAANQRPNADPLRQVVYIHQQPNPIPRAELNNARQRLGLLEARLGQLEENMRDAAALLMGR